MADLALGFPAIPGFSSCDWRLRINAADFRSPLNGNAQSRMRAGARWRATLQCPPYNNNDAGIVNGVLSQIARRDRYIYLSPPQNQVRGNWNPAELVANGTFLGEVTTGWTAANSGVLSVNARRLKIANGGASPAYAFQDITCEANKPHVLIVDGAAGSHSLLYATLTQGGASTVEEQRSQFTLPTRAVLPFTPSQNSMRVNLQQLASAVAGSYLYVGGISVCRCLTVNGGGQVGNALNVDGGPTSTLAALKVGEFVTFRGKNRWQMVRLTEDFDTDANGAGTLRFEPAIRDVPIDGEAVIVRNPFARFRKGEPEAISEVSAPNFSRMAFDLEEDINTISGEIQSDLVWAWDADNLTLAPQIGTGTPAVTQATAVATYVDSTGILRAAPANTARFDYDPVTLALRGFLFEPIARTNGITNSQDESSGTSLTGATLSLDATTAPDGTTTADKIQETNANSEHTSSRTVVPTTTASTIQPPAVFVKAAERTWAVISTVNRDGAVWRSWVNLSTGVAGTTNANHTIKVWPAPLGFWRIECRFNSGAAAGAMQWAVSCATGDNVLNYVGTTGSGIYIWGRQWEADQPNASSYIATGGTAVTRNADSISLANPSGFAPSSGGGVLLELERGENLSGSQGIFSLALASPNTSDGIEAALFSTYAPGLFVSTASATQASINVDASATALGSAIRVANGWATNDFATDTNGGTAATDVSGSVPAALTQMLWGRDRGNANSLTPTLRFRKIRLIGRKPPNQTLKALSA